MRPAAPAYQQPQPSSPLASVQAALQPRQATPPAAAAPQQPPVPPAAPHAAAPAGTPRQIGSERILLVEDQLTNRLVVENMLENINMKTVHAENGEVAVNKVRQEEYDLILMDVQMPVMNGYDATVNIRKFEVEAGRKPCQIIAVTANAMQGDREKCLQAGMNDYLAKPIQAPELERMVRKYLAIAMGLPEA